MYSRADRNRIPLNSKATTTLTQFNRRKLSGRTYVESRKTPRPFSSFLNSSTSIYIYDFFNQRFTVDDYIISPTSIYTSVLRCLRKDRPISMALEMREATGSDLHSSVSCSDLCSGESGSSPWILSVLDSLLHRLVARHERLMFSSGKEISRENLCVFSAMQVPAISLQKYLERLFKYVRCSPSAFVVAYVYIDRLLLTNPNFRLTTHNMHMLTITSVMVATKFLDDEHYSNDYFAKVGGLTLREMNILEVEFLFMLRFRLQVTVSVFESYCSHFKREIELGGGFQIERILLSLPKNKSLKSCSEEESNKQRLGISYNYAGC